MFRGRCFCLDDPLHVPSKQREAAAALIRTHGGTVCFAFSPRAHCLLCFAEAPSGSRRCGQAAAAAVPLVRAEFLAACCRQGSLADIEPYRLSPSTPSPTAAPSPRAAAEPHPAAPRALPPPRPSSGRTTILAGSAFAKQPRITPSPADLTTPTSSASSSLDFPPDCWVELASFRDVLLRPAPRKPSGTQPAQPPPSHGVMQALLPHLSVPPVPDARLNPGEWPLPQDFPPDRWVELASFRDVLLRPAPRKPPGAQPAQPPPSHGVMQALLPHLSVPRGSGALLSRIQWFASKRPRLQFRLAGLQRALARCAAARPAQRRTFLRQGFIPLLRSCAAFHTVPRPQRFRGQSEMEVEAEEFPPHRNRRTAAPPPLWPAEAEPSLRADLRALRRRQRFELDASVQRVAELEERSDDPMADLLDYRRLWKAEARHSHLLRKAQRKAQWIKRQNQRRRGSLSWAHGASRHPKLWRFISHWVYTEPTLRRERAALASFPWAHPGLFVRQPGVRGVAAPPHRKGYAGKALCSVADLSFDVGALDFSLAFTAQAQHNAAFRDLVWEDGVAFPPTASWLYKRMTGEWVGTGDPARAAEWHYVHAPVPPRAPAHPPGRDAGHAGHTPDAFLAHPAAQAAALTFPEVVALRLYTGPAFALINAAHRRGESQEFAVTSYCLEAAIIKLALNGKKMDTMRGLIGRMPDTFVAAYEYGQRLRHGDAICDAAFMSTTRSLDVATNANYGGDTLFVIRGRKNRDCFLRTGADVSWVSQFPHEQEVLFPCYTELWFVPMEKRDRSQRWYALAGKKQLFEFTVRCYYDHTRGCPYVAGLDPEAPR
eukprot:EG_transcript_2582